MNKKEELAKNTLIISIGRISTQFISFLLLPLYTSLLSTDEYGTIDLVNTYAQFFLPIVIFQMDQALLRFMIEKRNSINEQKNYISTAALFLIFQIVIYSVIFFIATRFVHNNYSIHLYTNVIAMCLSGFSFQAARGFGDNVTYSIASFLSGFFTIGFNILFIVGLQMKAEGALIAAVIGNIAASLYVFIKDHIFSCIKISLFNKELLINMLKYAWPLIPNALIWWIVNASDRSIVLAFLGTSANGILAVSHKFPTLIMTLYNIFHISWTESAALHLKEPDKDIFFSNIFDLIFRIFSTLCILLIAVMPFLFPYLINSNFAEAYYQIPIYTIASLLNIIVGLYSVIYISEMKTGEIAKTSALAGIINVVVSLVTIKYIGLYATSVSSAIAFGTMAIYRGIDTRRFIKQRLSISLFISILLMLFVGIIAYYTNSFLLKFIYLLIALAYGFMINFKNIGKIIDVVKIKLFGQ